MDQTQLKTKLIGLQTISLQETEELRCNKMLYTTWRNAIHCNSVQTLNSYDTKSNEFKKGDLLDFVIRYEKTSRMTMFLNIGKIWIVSAPSWPRYGVFYLFDTDMLTLTDKIKLEIDVRFDGDFLHFGRYLFHIDKQYTKYMLLISSNRDVSKVGSNPQPEFHEKRMRIGFSNKKFAFVHDTVRKRVSVYRCDEGILSLDNARLQSLSDVFVDSGRANYDFFYRIHGSIEMYIVYNMINIMTFG